MTVHEQEVTDEMSPTSHLNSEEPIDSPLNKLETDDSIETRAVTETTTTTATATANVISSIIPDDLPIVNINETTSETGIEPDVGNDHGSTTDTSIDTAIDADVDTTQINCSESIQSKHNQSSKEDQDQFCLVNLPNDDDSNSDCFDIAHLSDSALSEMSSLSSFETDIDIDDNVDDKVEDPDENVEELDEKDHIAKTTHNLDSIHLIEAQNIHKNHKNINTPTLNTNNEEEQEQEKKLQKISISCAEDDLINQIKHTQITESVSQLPQDPKLATSTSNLESSCVVSPIIKEERPEEAEEEGVARQGEEEDECEGMSNISNISKIKNDTKDEQYEMFQLESPKCENNQTELGQLQQQPQQQDEFEQMHQERFKDQYQTMRKQHEDELHEQRRDLLKQQEEKLHQYELQFQRQLQAEIEKRTQLESLHEIELHQLRDKLVEKLGNPQEKVEGDEGNERDETYEQGQEKTTENQRKKIEGYKLQITQLQQEMKQQCQIEVDKQKAITIEYEKKITTAKNKLLEQYEESTRQRRMYQNEQEKVIQLQKELENTQNELRKTKQLVVENRKEMERHRNTIKQQQHSQKQSSQLQTQLQLQSQLQSQLQTQLHPQTQTQIHLQSPPKPQLYSQTTSTTSTQAQTYQTQEQGQAYRHIIIQELHPTTTPLTSPTPPCKPIFLQYFKQFATNSPTQNSNLSNQVCNYLENIEKYEPQSISSSSGELLQGIYDNCFSTVDMTFYFNSYNAKMSQINTFDMFTAISMKICHQIDKNMDIMKFVEFAKSEKCQQYKVLEKFHFYPNAVLDYIATQNSTLK